MTISSWPLQREVFNLFQQVIVNLSSSPRSSIAMRHHQNHNVCHLPHVNQQTLQHRKCLQMVQQIENVSDHIAPFLSLFYSEYVILWGTTWACSQEVGGSETPQPSCIWRWFSKIMLTFVIISCSPWPCQHCTLVVVFMFLINHGLMPYRHLL